MRTIKRSVFFVFSKRKRVMSKFCIYFVCTFNYDANLECNVVLLCEIGACWVQVLLSPTKRAIRGKSKGNNSLTLAKNFELVKHRRSRVTNAPYKLSLHVVMKCILILTITSWFCWNVFFLSTCIFKTYIELEGGWRYVFNMYLISIHGKRILIDFSTSITYY